MATEDASWKGRQSLNMEKMNPLKDILAQENKIIQEMGIIQDESKSGQNRLKNMWNKIRTKIMVEYILLIDNFLIALWFGVMALNAYDYYIEFNISFNYRFYNTAKALLYLSNVLNLLMLVLNILRKVFLYKLTAYRATTNIKEQMYEMLFLELPIESALIVLNPNPLFLYKKSLKITETLFESNIQYIDNDILQLLSLLKIFVLLRAFLTKSVWYSDRAYRVCQIFSFEMSYMFVIRSLMYHSPFVISFSWNFIGVMLFAFAIRTTEKPLKMATDRMDHSQFISCVWESFITMTTVGYGDFFPRTNKGRMIMVLCALYGILGLSLIVVSVTNILQMSIREKRAYLLLKRVNHKQKMRNVSMDLITKAISYSLAKKRDYDSAEVIFDKMQDVYEELHEVSEQYKELTSMISMEEKALYSFTFIHSNITKLREDVEGLCAGLGIDSKAVLAESLNKNSKSKTPS